MNPDMYPWGVNRLRAQFVSPSGKPSEIYGTGFWVNVDSYLRDYAFVTNRHNVDPTLKLGPGFRLLSLEIELRPTRRSEDSSESFIILPETDFFRVKHLETALYLSENADCALLYPPVFQDLPEDYKPLSAARTDDLADAEFLDRNVMMTDACHFIGFPFSADGKFAWWDQSSNTPIARFASIASHSRSYMPFKHPGIKTEDVTLVSGLSFKGSSGSPLILDQKGIGTDHPRIAPSSYIKEGPRGPLRASDFGFGPKQISDEKNTTYYFVDENFVPSKLIGIMSGHCPFDDNAETSSLEHSGLSYFTRSTSIAALFEKAGFVPPSEDHPWWRHPNEVAKEAANK